MRPCFWRAINFPFNPLTFRMYAKAGDDVHVAGRERINEFHRSRSDSRSFLLLLFRVFRNGTNHAAARISLLTLRKAIRSAADIREWIFIIRVSMLLSKERFIPFDNSIIHKWHDNKPRSLLQYAVYLVAENETLVKESHSTHSLIAAYLSSLLIAANPLAIIYL